MPKALIISDSLTMTFAMENAFSMAGWSSNSISVHSMLSYDSSSVSNYQCLVLVVDTDFRKRFGSVIDEMCLIANNYSQLSSFYLVFEADYDPSFAPWLEYTRRMFKLNRRTPGLQKAMHEIVNLESEEATSTAFVSPMDTI